MLEHREDGLEKKASVQVEGAHWLFNTLLSMTKEEISDEEILDLVQFAEQQGTVNLVMAEKLREAVDVRAHGTPEERNRALKGILTMMTQMSREEIDPKEIEDYIQSALRASNISEEQATELREKIKR